MARASLYRGSYRDQRISPISRSRLPTQRNRVARPMCRSSARAARLIFSPFSHILRARLKASRGVGLVMVSVTVVSLADLPFILAIGACRGYGSLYPQVANGRIRAEVVQYLGLEQFGGGDGVDQRIVAGVVGQAVADPAVGQADRDGLFPHQLLPPAGVSFVVQVGFDGHGVDDREEQLFFQAPLQGHVQERPLYVAVVHHGYAALEVLEQGVEHLGKVRGVFNFAVGNAVNGNGVLLQRQLRADDLVPGLAELYAAQGKRHQADADNGVLDDVQAGGFEVQGDQRNVAHGGGGIRAAGVVKVANPRVLCLFSPLAVGVWPVPVTVAAFDGVRHSAWLRRCSGSAGISGDRKSVV